jgi:hypothetical protein
MATLGPMAQQNPVGPGTVEIDGRDGRGDLGDLVAHVARTTRLPTGVARRVVDDVVAYFAEPAEAVVRRRHRELQATGMPNPRIFDRIAAELAERPVAAPTLTPRQIRRIVYG